MQGQRDHVVCLDHMTAFGDTIMIDPDQATVNQSLCVTPVLHEARIDQPLVNPLAQFSLSVICAFIAARTAKGEFGSIGFSRRSGFGGGPLRCSNFLSPEFLSPEFL